MTITGIAKNHKERLIKRHFWSPSAANEFSNHMRSQALSDEITSFHQKLQHFNSKLRSALNIKAPEKTKKKSQIKVMPLKNEWISLLKREL